MNDPFQEIKDIFVLFLCAMTAVFTRIIKTAEKPSKMFILGEVLVGLAFCFFVAPAVKEYWQLSIEVTCAITWFGAFFSSLVLKGVEGLITAYFKKVTPKEDESD